MATLSVQEAMGLKVDREAVATLVLPQLWAMSIGPCKLTFILCLPTPKHPLDSAERRTIQTIYGCYQEVGGSR
jgi:SCY1-like protein 2